MMLIITMTMMIFVMMIMIRMAKVLCLILAVNLLTPTCLFFYPSHIFQNPVFLQGVYMMILRNFERHYQTNRAPFGLFYHPAWWAKP